MLLKLKNAVKLASIVVTVSALSACMSDVSSEFMGRNGPSPIALKVGEGFVNPTGYYESQPRFSWQLSSDAVSSKQTAYQVQVASMPELLDSSPDLWESQKITSPSTTWIKYQGKTLASRQALYWRVRTWDEQDHVSNWSEIQTIEYGLLTNNDWQAQWIGHPDTAMPSDDTMEMPSQETLATPQYLRKSFEVKGAIKKARLYITAKGLFKPYINGDEVSKVDVMTPGWTPYAKRIESLSYDLTDRLVPGENTIAASIAGGWYAGRMANFVEKEHRLPARLLAQLEITYEDNTVQYVVSDNSWFSSQEGPIRFASIFDGERYDQHKEQPGWNANDFTTKDWLNTITEPLESDVAIAPKRHAPIRITEQMPVSEIVNVKDDVVVMDFGQNMVGVPKLSIPGIAGQQIKIRYAEALHKGQFYTDNYRSAKSTNYIMPSQTGMVDYQPTFTYHGYRYIEISGFDTQHTPQTSWATALIQHSDVDINANFTSSHAKLNKLSENIVWGMRSNFYDIPLDCPQRDERLGWTGDAQVFVTPSMYMADVYGFWSAWLQSVREEQGPDGKIPLYIPFVEWINFASSGWGDAVTIIPWELYTVTGDEQILADNYEMMKGWVNYHQKKSKNNISTMTTFGDWLQPFPIDEENRKDSNRGDTDFSLIGTAYFARSIELTINAANVLGQDDDVKTLSALRDQVINAFRTRFFDEELNLLNARPTQTTYLLGLAYDLFPENKRAIAIDKLIALLDHADMHLRTGFLGTPLLTQVLQDAGRSDVIYELLFKETYPSWFHSINNGATTTWERWNSYSIEDGFNPQGMNSLNHYAYGTISRWFYEGILGITPAKPGFKSIRIEPQFSNHLEQATGSYKTPHGEVSVSWKIDNNRVSIDVVVPKNTTADIVLPIVDKAELVLNGQAVDSLELNNIQPGSYQIKANITL